MSESLMLLGTVPSDFQTRCLVRRLISGFTGLSVRFYWELVYSFLPATSRLIAANPLLNVLCD